MTGLCLEMLVRVQDRMGPVEESLVGWGWECRDST